MSIYIDCIIRKPKFLESAELEFGFWENHFIHTLVPLGTSRISTWAYWVVRTTACTIL